MAGKTDVTMAKTATHEELLAIKMALMWALEQEWKRIVVFSDSLVIVKALNAGKKLPN